MKKRMWFLLLFPVIALFFAVILYWDFFCSNLFWLSGSTILVLLWLVFVGLVNNINCQINDNPYYTQMVLRKRDEVRELQRAYAATHKGV